MSVFGPRRLEPGDDRKWIKQATELVRRRKWLFGLLSALSILPFLWSNPILEIVGVTLTPFWLLLGFKLAEMADHSQRASDLLSAENRSAIGRSLEHLRPLMLETLFLTSAILALITLSDMLFPASATPHRSVPLIAGISFPAILFSLQFAGIGLVAWAVRHSKFFLRLPLSLFARLTPEAVALQLRQFNAQNAGLSRSMDLTESIFMAVSLCPLLVIATLPLFCCYGYVAYRDVWGGQGENERVKARIKTPALTPALQS